jgi:hypothetical protein
MGAGISFLLKATVRRIIYRFFLLYSEEMLKNPQKTSSFGSFLKLEN